MSAHKLLEHWRSAFGQRLHQPIDLYSPRAEKYHRGHYYSHAPSPQESQSAFSSASVIITISVFVLNIATVIIT